MPEQTFRHRARTDASLEEVWSALQDASTWAGIGGVDEVTEVEHTPDGNLAGYGFTTTVKGVRYRGEAATIHASSPATMSMRVSGDLVEGSITVELSPDREGTLIDVRLTARSRGLLAAMAFPAIAVAIGKGLPANVERFARELG